MKTASLLSLCAILAIACGILIGITTAAVLDAQSLRRERDLALSANDQLIAEHAAAWKIIHQLRSTLAAHEIAQPDPAAAIQFLDN